MSTYVNKKVTKKDANTVNVLRFWEHDIVNNPEIVKKKITKGIHPF